MKKRLLNEDVTRRFMKLANLGPLSENFVSETEVDLEEAYSEEEEPEMDAGAEPEMDMDAEPEMDMDAEPEMDMGAEGVPGDLDASALIDAVAQATLDALKTQGLVSDETTVAVDGEGSAEEAPLPEPEMDMDAEPEMDMGAEPEMGMGAEPEMDDEEELAEDTRALEELDKADVSLEEDDAFTNEVTRRVAERILAIKK